MKIVSGGREISCLEDWGRYAGPKSASQWVEYRSAYELAHAWCARGAIAIPEELKRLLDSCDMTRGLSVEVAHPELRIAFDRNGGEPRNADLAFVGRNESGLVAVTIEAKADEPFGSTVSDTIAAALERLIENPRSRGLRRVEELVRALFPARRSGAPSVAGLRYQLLTAVAGSLAFAAQSGAATAVMVVHEFVTKATSDEKHRGNAADYRAFLQRLMPGEPLRDESVLLGPVVVPGAPLWESPARLYVGKVVSERGRAPSPTPRRD